MSTKQRMKTSLEAWEPFLRAGGENALIQELRGFSGDLYQLGGVIYKHIPDVVDVSTWGSSTPIPQRNPLEVDYAQTRWEVIQKFDDCILPYLENVLRKLDVRPSWEGAKGVLCERMLIRHANKVAPHYMEPNSLADLIGRDLNENTYRWIERRHTPLWLSHSISASGAVVLDVRWQGWMCSNALRLLPIVCKAPVKFESWVAFYPDVMGFQLSVFEILGTNMTYEGNPSDWGFLYPDLQAMMAPVKDSWTPSHYALQTAQRDFVWDLPDDHTNLTEVLLEVMDIAEFA